MTRFGEQYPVSRDPLGIYAGACGDPLARLPAAPEFALSVSNVATDFWQFEDGMLFQEDDGTPVILE
jgi:hypothetical protein